MRRALAWTSILLAAATSTGPIALAQTTKPRAAAPAPSPAAKAQPGAAAKAAPAPVDPKAKAADEAKKREEMNLLLAEWEKQSKKVTSLQVIFERIDKSTKWGDQVYQGQAMLKSPDLACLEFKKAIPDADGKPKVKTDSSGQKVIEVEEEPFQRIVCTGKEVLQYEFDEKAIYIYPLDKEARQKALQQGPLPFLFNMKAADARKRYGMTLIDQNADMYLIGIVPNEEIDKQSFARAFVYLRRSDFLPSRLTLMPVGDKDTQEFRFTLIAPNTAINDKYFHPPINVAGWKINRNEPQANGAGPAPAAAAVAAPPRRGAAQPAPRTAVRN